MDRHAPQGFRRFPGIHRIVPRLAGQLRNCLVVLVGEGFMCPRIGFMIRGMGGVMFCQFAMVLAVGRSYQPD